MNSVGTLATEVVDNDGNRDASITSVLSGIPYDQWVLINPYGWRPSARYKHAAEMVHEKLYVIGGSRNGRYLSDVQVFDLRNLKWSSLSLCRDPNSSKLEDSDSEEVLPATSGHSLVKWENKLLVVAGHSKASLDAVTVWSINLETHNFSIVKTYGKIPAARGGQSVTLVGSNIIMFGGEDNRRRLLNDLHILDLKSMTWDVLEAKNTSPSPRFDHIAALHAEQYFLIFGGSSHSTCFSDLHILDLQTMEWSQPETQGSYLNPRGGHAGATVDENWYIAGGGDNKSGAPETIVLNMSKLVWSVASHVRERDPLASEGLSLCSATIDGEKVVVAFGGYNGKYNNEVHVLKPKPRDSVQPRLFQSPAAAAAAASVTAAYALTIIGSDNKSTDFVNIIKDASSRDEQEKDPVKVAAVDTDAIRVKKEILESRIVEVKDKNSRLKGNLDVLNNSHSELSMELQSVQGQLAAERSRCLKLEVHIAETRKKLESLDSIEHELEILRNQKSQTEGDVAVVQRQKSGGVWQWIAGNNTET